MVAVAFAHGCGLYVPLLPREYRWTQAGGIITAAILAAMILGPIWTNSGSPEYYRFMAVVVIVGVLFSLLVPILSKLKGSAAVYVAGTPAPPSLLVLELVSPGLYRDQTGACFNVHPADPFSASDSSPPSSRRDQ